MMKLLFAALLLFCGMTGPEALEAQSVRTSIVAAPAPGMSGLTVRVFNDSSLRDFANIVMEWQILANGQVRQKGKAGNLAATPKHPALVRLPVRLPPGNEELFLRVWYSYRKGRPVGRPEQLLLRAWNGRDLPLRGAGDLSYTDENGLFTIQSPAIRLVFDKQTGWLQHYEIKGRQLLEDTLNLRTGFWVTSAMEGYAAAREAEAAPWQAAGRSPRLQLFSTSTGSRIVIVRAEYTLPETSCLLHLSYTVNAAGELLVEQSMEGDSTQKGPSLPRFGMQWAMPPGFDSVTWYGVPPGEVDPAIIHPREAGAGAGVRWYKLTAPDGAGLLVTADSSLLRCAALPSGSGSQLNIDYPSLPYQLPYGNYRYVYKVSPLLPAAPDQVRPSGTKPRG